jgi:hypothetical protein
MLASELKQDAPGRVLKQERQQFDVDALPPGFRMHIDSLNLNYCEDEECEHDEETLAEISAGSRTRSGIPLPFADPAVGGGLFPARLFRRHAEMNKHLPEAERRADTRLLLSKLQLLDICATAVEVTRRRLSLELVRWGLASLDENAAPHELPHSEVETLLRDSVAVGDSLRGEWPWSESPRLLMANPPWLRIKDRFRGHPDGSKLRKELGHELRTLCNEDGSPRFSTLRGNVNLYRLFLERSLQLIRSGGRVRMIVPDSLLREQSSVPLRTLLVSEHEWTSIWYFPESARLFSGVTQGVLVFGATVGGETQELIVRGPADSHELSGRDGLAPSVPTIKLDRERWGRWSRGEWAVPRLPRDPHERQRLLKTIDELAELPRLADLGHWLAGSEERVRVRVGEIDQTTWAKDIKPWRKGSRGTPFIRGLHFSSRDDGSVILIHPSTDTSLAEDAVERKQARWVGNLNPPSKPRLACQAIVNAQQSRRLRWLVLPAGYTLGNSVNHLELPAEVEARLCAEYGGIQGALEWLCELLNSKSIDCWARAWAANNNVNNYELEMLPLPPVALDNVKATIAEMR